MHTLMISSGTVVREPNAESIRATLSECDTDSSLTITLKNNFLKNYYVSAEGSAENGFILEFKLSAAEHYKAEPPYLTINEVIEVLQQFVEGTPAWMSRFPFRRVPRPKRTASAPSPTSPSVPPPGQYQQSAGSSSSAPVPGTLKPSSVEQLRLPSGHVAGIPKRSSS